MPIRSHERETCHGTSDNVVVPIDEFYSTLDGAIRIARYTVSLDGIRLPLGKIDFCRSFDDGLAECGLICPSEIMALDKKMAKYFHLVGQGRSMNTVFPCG
jgi:hypothetical protein